MTNTVQEMAPVILDAITKSKKILLHCHPSPDPDSLGSVLAMKAALEQLGKNVTPIRGDSEIPKAFGHFPGIEGIVQKSFNEINLSDFDLFIILDSGSPEMISRTHTPVFPLPIKTIVIDHHATNTKYADINLLDATYPAAAQILFDLFKIWNITITKEIASNLFIGMYTDTGGFKYGGTTSATLQAVSELLVYVPDFTQLISKMENSRRKEALVYNGMAISSFKTYFNDQFAISCVGYDLLSKNNITSEDISSVPTANILMSVSEVIVGISITEEIKGHARVHFRSKDIEKFDISRLAVALGGGGHKAACGARLEMSAEEALKKVVETAKVIYNL